MNTSTSRMFEYIVYTEQEENLGTMVHDGIYNPVIHLCRVILPRMIEPYIVVSLYLTSTFLPRNSTFVSGVLLTSSPVSHFQGYAINDTFYESSLQDA